MSETPAIDPAALRIVAGHLVQATDDDTLWPLMTVTELAELIRSGPPALPEPDRWIPDGDGHRIPRWDAPGVTAWTGGVDAPNDGYREDLDNVERTALAILSAVRYARRFTTDSPVQSSERSPLWT